MYATMSTTAQIRITGRIVMPSNSSACECVCVPERIAAGGNHTSRRPRKRVSHSAMSQQLNIWCNAKFPEPAMAKLRQGLKEHPLIEAAAASASNLDAGQADPQLEQADVALGQPDPDQVMRLPRLKWVQL